MKISLPEISRSNSSIDRLEVVEQLADFSAESPAGMSQPTPPMRM